MRSNLLPFLLLPLGLAACSAPEHLRPDFGYSVRNNVVAQTLEPGAAERAHAPQMGDGQKMEQALKDYRKGKPEATRDHLIVTNSK